MCKKRFLKLFAAFAIMATMVVSYVVPVSAEPHFTVTFDTNGGTQFTGEFVQTTITNPLEGYEFWSGQYPVAQKDGCNLIGWSTEPVADLEITDDESAILSKLWTPTNAIDQNITVYAVYKKNEAPIPAQKTINVVYNANGGHAPKLGDLDESGNTVTRHYTYITEGPLAQDGIAVQIAKLSEAIFVRDGYRLVGWNTKADGSGETYKGTTTPDEAPVLSEDLTLYAQWEKVEVVSTKPTKTATKVTSPATGDSVNGAAWLALALTSLIGALLVSSYNLKKSK